MQRPEQRDFAWLQDSGKGPRSKATVRSSTAKQFSEENFRGEISEHNSQEGFWRFRVRCNQSNCNLQWLVQFYVQRQGHPPGTLLAYKQGEHNHTVDDKSTGGQIFTPQQQANAQAYVSTCSGRKRARELRASLRARGATNDALPTNKQLSEWLRRDSKRRRLLSKGIIGQPDSQHIVAVVSISVEE
jgi:hypothetical protein